jgi:hypothetical protein
MSKIINIDEIEKGMILAESITNNQGQILFGSGAELSEKHKKYFKMWGVTSVLIESEESDEFAKPDLETLDKIRAEFIEQLSWKPRNEHEQDLIEMAILHQGYKAKNHE